MSLRSILPQNGQLINCDWSGRYVKKERHEQQRIPIPIEGEISVQKCPRTWERMDKSIWRISLASGAAAATLVALFFVYQYVQGTIPNERVEGLTPILLFVCLIFLFVVALISFLFFWVKSIRWFVALSGLFTSRGIEAETMNHKDVLGLLISCALIAITIVFWGFIEWNHITKPCRPTLYALSVCMNVRASHFIMQPAITYSAADGGVRLKKPSPVLEVLQWQVILY